MKLRIKPVLLAALWWVLISTEVFALSTFPSLATKGMHGFVFTDSGLLAHFVLTVLISAGIAFLRFRKQSGTFADGLRFGALVALVGLALDAILTVPFFVKSYGFYFGKWSVWFGYLLAVLAFGVFARIFSRKA